MRTLVAILALTTFVSLSVPPLTADETPHRSFLQKLRDRGEADLALQYLTEVLSKNPPAELKPLLPLEMAKTLLESANLKNDSGQRSAMYKQARSEFETFIQKNPAHPLVADANLEIARILALEGKAQYSLARRQETKEAREQQAKIALKMFSEAARRLQSAAKQIDDRLAKLPTPPKTPQDRDALQALTETKIRAEFEQGMNLVYQARAYRLLGEAENNFKTVEKARDIMKVVAAHPAKNTLCWQARAWVGWTYQVTDKNDDARKEFLEQARSPTRGS